jgi:hypothetical protein
MEYVRVQYIEDSGRAFLMQQKRMVHEDPDKWGAKGVAFFLLSVPKTGTIVPKTGTIV